MKHTIFAAIMAAVMTACGGTETGTEPAPTAGDTQTREATAPQPASGGNILLSMPIDAEKGRIVTLTWAAWADIPDNTATEWRVVISRGDHVITDGTIESISADEYIGGTLADQLTGGLHSYRLSIQPIDGTSMTLSEVSLSASW